VLAGTTIPPHNKDVPYSWDILIPAGLALLGVYAALLLRGRAISLTLGAYLAYLVAEHWGRSFYGLLTGSQSFFGFSLSLNVSPFLVSGMLFGILFVIFSTVVLVGVKMKLTTLENILYGLFAGGIVAVALMSFMADEDRVRFVAQSFSALILDRYRELLFLLPVMLMIWTGLRPHPEDRRH
jgi:hypothetical protein